MTFAQPNHLLPVSRPVPVTGRIPLSRFKELLHDDNLQLGMLPDEARRQAMIKLGGIESTKEACRNQRGLPVLETLWQDVRYGTRMLWKNPLEFYGRALRKSAASTVRGTPRAGP